MTNYYIPLTECKHSYLYRIFSRNLLFGIFNEDSSGFIGIREKFGYRYLFTEYHRDLNNHCATVSPKEELCFCPLKLDKDSPELFKWLEMKGNEYT
jgi:hypothetical protein